MRLILGIVPEPWLDWLILVTKEGNRKQRAYAAQRQELVCPKCGWTMDYTCRCPNGPTLPLVPRSGR